MPAAPLPADEIQRLAALVALNIMETERTAEFDIFPALAQGVFSTPIAAISLIDENRQWFKASIGLEVSETPREQAFCAHALLNPTEVFCIPDAAADPRFADNPLVTGSLGIRFYAGMPIIGPGGDPLGALCVLDRVPRQVTPESLEQLKRLAIGVSSALKLHASIQNLKRLASTDSLTGIHNRAGFEHRVRAALARGGATLSRVGLLFLDLDGFKAINDLFGHEGGDVALKQVALRLSKVVRADDVLGRFGGDEFCVLVEEIHDPAELRVLSHQIHAALTEPFNIERQSLSLRTSIGIATCLAGEEDAEDLVRKADAALYEAKRAGGGITRIAATAEARSPFVASGRLGTEAMLRDALFPPGREPFTLALQPMFHGVNGRLVGFETLVRWPGPDGLIKLPAEFISVAEATGLVVQLDSWMLDQACRLAASWPEYLQVSSNLSAANFFAGDLVAEVQATLSSHNLAPGRLKLEITETVLLCDPSRVCRIIAALRQLGVRVVLDDFGTGNASIAYLRDFAFDGLKIDRSFVSGLETDLQSGAFLRAINQMARALSLEVTAEGVETEGQLQLLRREGVGIVQGYLLGRPMAPRDAAYLIQQQPATLSPWVRQVEVTTAKNP